MKKILFPFRFNNLEEVLNDIDNQPKEFMYGCLELIKKYPDIDFFNVQRGARNTLIRKCLYPFELIFNKVTQLGIPFEIYLENRKSIHHAEIIFCNNDAISFSMLFWKKLGFIDAKVITLFQSLPERHNRYFKHNRLFVRFIKYLLSGSDKLLVLSSSAKSEMSKVFDVPSEKIEIFYFGADLSFWTYHEFKIDERDYILAIGNDMNRDFETLCNALSEKYKIIIVTGKKIKCKNIEIRSGLDNTEVKELYYGARLVITPSIKLLTESSGLSTTVQAMACGTPVVISDSLPMRELFTENSNILYFEPENVSSLSIKINEVWDNQELLNVISINARNLIEKKFNSQKMAEQLERILI